MIKLLHCTINKILAYNGIIYNGHVLSHHYVFFNLLLPMIYVCRKYIFYISTLFICLVRDNVKQQTSHFLQLYQHPSTVLRVKKHHWLAMGTNPGFLAQAPDVLGCQIIHGCPDIIYLNANVVHPSVLVLLQEILKAEMK